MSTRPANATRNYAALALILALSVGLWFEARWLHRIWAERGWLYEWVMGTPDADGAMVATAHVHIHVGADRGDRDDARIAALHVLAREASPEGVAALEAVLAGDADVEVRRQAAYALGTTGSHRAVAVLLRVAHSNAPLHVRKASVEALGTMESEAARAALHDIAATVAGIERD